MIAPNVSQKKRVVDNLLAFYRGITRFIRAVTGGKTRFIQVEFGGKTRFIQVKFGGKTRFIPFTPYRVTR